MQRAAPARVLGARHRVVKCAQRPSVIELPPGAQRILEEDVVRRVRSDVEAAGSLVIGDEHGVVALGNGRVGDHAKVIESVAAHRAVDMQIGLEPLVAGCGIGGLGGLRQRQQHVQRHRHDDEGHRPASPSLPSQVLKGAGTKRSGRWIRDQWAPTNRSQDEPPWRR